MNYEELYTLAAQVEERLQPVFRGFETHGGEEYEARAGCLPARTACPSRALPERPAMATMISDAKRWKRSMRDVFGAEAALVRTTLCERHARDCLRALRRSPAGRHDPCRYGSAVRYAPHRHHRLRPRLARLATASGMSSWSLTSDGGPDYAAITQRVSELRPAAAFVQRSRGYAPRRALSVAEIGEIVRAVKAGCPNTAVIVDNCYGEFTEELRADGAWRGPHRRIRS